MADFRPTYSTLHLNIASATLAHVLEQVTSLEVLVGVDYSLELGCRHDTLVFGPFQLLPMDVLENAVIPGATGTQLARGPVSCLIGRKQHGINMSLVGGISSAFMPCSCARLGVCIVSSGSSCPACLVSPPCLGAPLRSLGFGKLSVPVCVGCRANNAERLLRSFAQ